MMRPSNKEIKAALLEARANITADKEEFLCHALPRDDAGDYIRSFIMQAIYPEDTLNGWIVSNVNDPSSPTKQSMKAYRLRWIDYMLKGL